MPDKRQNDSAFWSGSVTVDHSRRPARFCWLCSGHWLSQCRTRRSGCSDPDRGAQIRDRCNSAKLCSSLAVRQEATSSIDSHPATDENWAAWALHKHGVEAEVGVLFRGSTSPPSLPC